MCGTLLAVAWSLPAGAAEETAEYRVVFTSTWSSATHPISYPPGAHYSPLIGTTHDGSVRLWQEGALATAGIERMAEGGMSSPFDAEVGAAVASGQAREFLSAPGLRSPGTISMDFTIEANKPRVTLVAMIAPSPDWFIGVESLSLIENGEWVQGKEIVLYPWDAGTDSGTTYTSANQDTRPQQPIGRLVTGPLGNGVPLGTLHFTRTDAPPPPPLVLGEGRFEVDVEWQTPSGTQGFGRAQPLTSDTGYFWFFRPENVELMVKVLDACSTFDRFWVFAGGLTSVEVTLRVRDTETDTVRQYRNPVSTPFQPSQDTDAFATCP